ncbi:hypothetical protein JAAARDRAFT_35522 [Jaapia argillacea MUCL 33604]|uniref:Transcription activator of gluconeogenesis ERT1 n=1 Tax=Jaapia argillacea MUCL 33604 TaxID=933084 RepID=A0A067PSN2_9AGAM|nr:hypothetical protein JAAARDRAFT_35522 [Jaapia argillacea MUCL 33604]
MSLTAINTAELIGNHRIAPSIPSVITSASSSSSSSHMLQQNSPSRSSSAHAVNGSATRKKASLSVTGRRKRSDSSDEGSVPSQTPRTREGPKKKKANRACLHCQKAHLTCDDSRPCQRCVRRGMANSCTEGIRKKAKYLLDDEELGKRTWPPQSVLPVQHGHATPEQLKKVKSQPPSSVTSTVAKNTPAPLTTSEPFPPNDPLFNISFDPNFSFGSEAANLEYSILSQILGSSPEPAPATPHTSTFASSAWPAEPLSPLASESQYSQQLDGSNDGYATSSAYGEQPLSVQPSDTTLSPESRASPNFMMLSYPTPSQLQEQHPQLHQKESQLRYPSSYTQSTSSLQSYSSHYSKERSVSLASDTTSQYYTNASKSSDVGLVSPPLSVDSPSTESGSGPASAHPSSVTSIYDCVRTPYDYTEGYHFLMKHLPSRFEKNDILRIVRALAIIRPSLIALQMPLSEEDEVFVEKCFQRSIIELDKLISFNGTPTVVWRRTGEICLVGSEFCMLTDWPREELLGGRKFIYELFENQSVVEYWENFASHAFENTTQSVYSHCVLLKPSGAPVPCTFCFSIRRDIFDLPSLVIGQWLPLL